MDSWFSFMLWSLSMTITTVRSWLGSGGGWFGGGGFSGTMEFFGKGHVPAVFAFLAIAAEFFGSIGLITGLLTRIAAIGISINMLVAIFTVHAGNGMFMNWSGNQKGEGFEFHLLVLGMTLALMLKGAGALSVDKALAKTL